MNKKITDKKYQERIICETADGSHTLYVPALKEHFHSVNGAVRESLHVYIHSGLSFMEKEKIRILEIGFGTGLNAFLTLQETVSKKNHHIYYYAVEKYPLEENIWKLFNYGDQVWEEGKDFLNTFHTSPWDEPVRITENFILHKIEADSNQSDLPSGIDLIYYDAFAPEKQPEMWTQEVFNKLYKIAAPNAIIVTYCAKGEVRRQMQAAGFSMERLPGPPGKRHILFGKKKGITTYAPLASCSFSRILLLSKLSADKMVFLR